MNQKKHISFSRIQHKGEQIIALRFAYNRSLIASVKRIPLIRWSQSKKCWYLKQNAFKLDSVKALLPSDVYLDTAAPALAENDETDVPETSKNTSMKLGLKVPQAYTNLLDLKQYSKSTKKVYLHYFGKFIRHFTGRDLKTIQVEDINQYLLNLIREKNISTSQQNQRINAIKFYYEKVLGRERR